MKIIPRGTLQLGDLRYTFPYVDQRPQALTDYAPSISTANTTRIDAAVIDQTVGCIYAKPKFVPHNQVLSSVSGATLVDNGQYLNLNLPDFPWESVVIGGGNGRVQCFESRPHLHQTVDVAWLTDSAATAMTLDALATCNTQGLVIELSRVNFGGVDPASGDYWEVHWVCNLRLYRMRVQAGTYPYVEVSDNNGQDWLGVTSRMKAGVGYHSVQGNALPGSQGASLAIQLFMMNRDTFLALGSDTVPLRVPAADPKPVLPPSGSVFGGGAIQAGTYSLAYSYVEAIGAARYETRLSPAATISLDSIGQIGTASVKPIPTGASLVRWYMSGPAGMRRVGENDGTGITISAVPNATKQKPVTANQIQPVFRRLRIKASQFTQLGFGAHPMKWALNCRFSKKVKVENNSGQPHYVLHGTTGMRKLDSGQVWALGFPAGSTLRATTLSGPAGGNVEYEVLLTNKQAPAPGAPPAPGGAPGTATYQNEPYADFTGALTRATVRMDGLVARAVSGGFGGGPGHGVGGVWPLGGGTPPPAPVNIVPRGISLQTTFDPNGLTIRRRLIVDMDNFHGQWRGHSGNMAIQLSLGYAAPVVPLQLKFTGVTHRNVFTRPYSNTSLFQLHCTDQSCQLDDTLVAAPPDFDGMNHYYVVSWLATYAGIPTGQQAWAALVPDDPYSSAAGDPDPYFLPLGEGMNPWTPRNRTLPVSQLLRMIQEVTGFLLYFDAAGMLQYHRWIPPNLGTAFKVFTEVPTGSVGQNLTEYWNPNIVTSTDEVRNELYLIGIDSFDPAWTPLVSVRRDELSIDAPYGGKPANYVGWRKSAIWVDSRFATADFASNSADRLIQILRLPEISASIETWLQPTVDVMQVIYVQDSKAGVQGIPFYVMGKNDRWAIAPSGQLTLRSMIAGRYLVG